jgi:hypothetical protein
MQRETTADREACTALRWRAAPYARPARTPTATFPLGNVIPGNGLRSRCSSTGDAPERIRGPCGWVCPWVAVGERIMTG